MHQNYPPQLLFTFSRKSLRIDYMKLDRALWSLFFMVAGSPSVCLSQLLLPMDTSWTQRVPERKTGCRSTKLAS